MNIQNIGYVTDLIFTQYDGTIEEKSDYFVIRTPSNPIFYWGNFLLFKKPPTRDDFAVWINAFHKEIGQDAKHVAIGWDSEEQGNVSPFKEAGFYITDNIILQLGELTPPKRPNDQLEIRPIENDAEWHAVIEQQIEGNVGEDVTPAYREFIERKAANYRKNQAAGHGIWWGAFLDGELVGNLGLYFSGDRKLGRYQDVVTSSKYRKRGVCSTLLWQVTQKAIKQYPDVELTIITEHDNPAQRIYESLGFARHSKMFGVSLDRKYEL